MPQGWGFSSFLYSRRVGVLNFIFARGGQLGKCLFLPGGGAPENWGRSGTLSKIKRGIKRFFQIKKGGSLTFFKEIKYFVKHSWNSC